MTHRFVVAVMTLVLTSPALAATTIPNEVKQPGTQQEEVSGLESPGFCDECHGGYSPAVEPGYNWRGGMMAHAGRDPIYWATLAVAEKDFDGAGDLCIRCHSPSGWLVGRSTPTDGSGLKPEDSEGVDCDVCHKLTNPDQSEHLGKQAPPFLARTPATPAEGFHGGGQYVIWAGPEKLGPYAKVAARHKYRRSSFHRTSELCGTCHDVSNPVTGDLAHNHGAQTPLPAGQFSGKLGSEVSTKAAFKNPPYRYGVVERTFSEHMASALSKLPISGYEGLPPELKAGSIKAAYDAAIASDKDGNFSDGAPRYFTCQTCHMSPVKGKGCNRKPATRTDLALHDLTGGNYWMPDAIKYLDNLGKLRLGGGLTQAQKDALTSGQERARLNLTRAASLAISGNTLTVVNLTGHKLTSGYPEGRRMWLRTRWYGAGGALLREDGAYGDKTVTLDGKQTVVRTLLDLAGANTRIYEVHGAMTQEWANQLLALGVSPSLALSFDRETGAVTKTLGQLGAQEPGTYAETFRFVINNHVSKDNRLPPYRMSYDESARRNTLPVPASQYGNPGEGGFYNHWDTFTLNPPAGATRATIELLYQPTSWEYVQFLYLANDRSNAFLANTGVDLLEAWRKTGMAEPQLMASVKWTGQASRPKGRR